MNLPPDEMRRLGYRVIDLLVDHFANHAASEAGRKGQPRELKALLAGGMPEEGIPVDTVLERLTTEILPNRLHVDHPRFFAFVPAPGNFVSVMADALASGYNVFAGSWLGGSGAAALELATVDWLREICGLPAGAAGLTLSGGSMANLTALAVARAVRLGRHRDDAAVYFSDQTHSSVERALRVLGFAPHQLRKLASDDDFRLPLAGLAAALAEDRRAGRLPFCVVANAGTTSTGAVDPLEELAGLCRDEGLWLHADGAYGAAAVISERGRAALAGLGNVDSLSLDPHKWLFQPFEIGCVLVRDGRHLTETFAIHPEYLRDVHRDPEEINFCDRGVQLTRGFRALKLWLSLQVFGVRAFREAVTRGFELAELA